MPFNALSESLSFHKSPESFISSRLAELARTDPSQLPSASASSQVLRASVLNRKVHIISDYRLCHQVLSVSNDDERKGSEDQPAPFQATRAYNDLMAPFFPPPNLLLTDGVEHSRWKRRWQSQIVDLPDTLATTLTPVIVASIHTKFEPNTTVEIYTVLKDMAWELLFSTFLPPQLDPPGSTHAKMLSDIERLQESLLRGQFSTVPVSIRTPLWSTSRSRGINARTKLQKVLIEHFASLKKNSQNASSCPLLARDDVTDMSDVANHVLLFTSGLANKALASLLLSSVMNIFLYRPHSPSSRSSSSPSPTLASLLRSLPPESAERAQMLRSMLLETERLSPPVVGVLRRANEATPLHFEAHDDPHIVPQGHEAWLYFPSASRSTSVFGDDAELFRWDRFMHTSPDDNPPQESFAFGAGPKTCLGRDVSRKMVELVVSNLLDSNIEMEAIPGNGLEPGVQAMLGWCTIEEAGGVEAIARDLKQLPTQRPRRPVLVRVTRRNRL